MGIYKDRLIEREASLKEGKYPELVLKAEDPIKWEILSTRLVGLVQNSRETAKRITASPVVREQGEFIFALMTPEGESVSYSSGLLLHIASLGSTAKWMLMNDYEEDPGINQGDFFFNNDAYLGGAHPQDQAIVTPIYYKDQLVGWAGGLSHVPETGSPEPGGNLPSARTRYSEGLVMPCVKVAEKEKIRRDLDIMVDRDVRVSTWWLLDNRAKIAGSKLIRDSVLKLIEEYGLDYYMEAIYEYIEDSRQACQKKAFQVLFPGKYRSVTFVDVPYVTAKQPVRQPVDYEIRDACEMTVDADGVITLDYEGTSPAGLHPYNATPIATRGTIGCMAIQHIFYDIRFNQGINQAICEGRRAILPACTMNPPDHTYATALFLAAFSAGALASSNISQAYYVMGFREEMMGNLATAIRIVAGGTRDQYGRPWAAQIFEHAASGLAPSGVHDGLDTAAIGFNPEGDMGDAEVWEKGNPLMWLGRGILPDTGGFGKYRGGNGIQSLYYMALADVGDVGCIMSCDYVFYTPGFMGGYPAASNYRYVSTETNLKELIEQQKPLPHSEGPDPAHPSWEKLVKGNHQRLPGQTFMMPLRKYDIWLQQNGGAGGFGDPIDRDPALVKKDIALNLTTPHAAEKVYGVAIDPQTFKVDYEATKRLREKIRQDRKARGIPSQKYLEGQREKIVKGNIPPNPKTCLNECFRISSRFLNEFKDFWKLPEEFKRID